MPAPPCPAVDACVVYVTRAPCYARSYQCKLTVAGVRAAVPTHVIPLPETLSGPKVELLMPVYEQATILRDWAAAANIKLRLCSCMGCAATATHTVSTCHTINSQLFDSLAESVHQLNGPSEWQATGRALASTVQAHVDFFLMLQADMSASKERVLAGMQCVEDWDHLCDVGLTDHVSEDDAHRVRRRLRWPRRVLVHVAVCTDHTLWLGANIGKQGLDFPSGPAGRRVAGVGEDGQIRHHTHGSPCTRDPPPAPESCLCHRRCGHAQL
jgi:hypothetical protein